VLASAINSHSPHHAFFELTNASQPRISLLTRTRASPTVWQILFPKSRCLPTPKIIWGGKKYLISNSLANFVSKNPLTKRKDPLSERRTLLSERIAPLSERRAPLSTRKLRCAVGALRTYMRAIDRDLPTCQRCQTQIPNY
jgi:hypothetical protein